ncbi:MAG TPA: hypothetical protein VEC37_07970 [Bacillota bacterium]|nr:hypothetical protein [Bacillota bacterium]
MWTNRRKSHFLMIWFQTAESRKFVLPIALMVLDQLFNALFELADFLEHILPSHRLVISCTHGKSDTGRKELHTSDIGAILGLIREFWQEIRGYGRWEVVRIESEEAQVKIEFF